jgi:hypothetical protein
MNREAFKILKCQGVDERLDIDLDEVICLDIGSCEVLSPIKQLINFLSAVDQRLKKLSEQTFLQAMIAIATNEAMLLHMHRGLEKFCDQYDGMDQEDVEALKNASN